MTIIPKHKRSPPNVALLRVNRQINEEATTILYSPAHHWVFLHEVHDLWGCVWSRFFPSRHLIRSLSKVSETHIN